MAAVASEPEAPISPAPVSAKDLSAALDQLSQASPDAVDSGLQQIQDILTNKEMRLQVYEFNGGKIISRLVELLGVQSSVQTTYQSAFCLWVLTLEAQVAQTLQQRFAAISKLTDALKSTSKEKIVRVILSTFKNLIHLAAAENTVPIVGSKILPFLDTLRQRKYSDEELTEDIDYLETYLREALQRLSTFEEYQGEVQSGKLEWSPAHTSDLFWKQNVLKFNEQNYDLVRALTRLLSISNDPLVLCIAAHDLGQYVKYYPSGKVRLQEVGAKHRLMEMMSHENADVRYQALVAVQKLMAQNWAF